MMASLDMSDAFDLSFLSPMVVTRRAETLVQGRSQLTLQSQGMKYAVINTASGRDREKIPEGTRYTDALSIVGRYQLQTARPGFQADAVLWKGNWYEVAHVDDYTHFGPGFTQAIVIDMTSPGEAV